MLAAKMKKMTMTTKTRMDINIMRTMKRTKMRMMKMKTIVMGVALKIHNTIMK